MNEEKVQKRNKIITWIVRAVAMAAEILFFVPLCTVSCSAGEKYDKVINGPRAVFGFELSYVDDRIEGIWWFVFVFLITAGILLLWFVKKMKCMEKIKGRELILCALTGSAAMVNVLLIIAFMAKAEERIRQANLTAALGAVSLKFSLGLYILLFLQIILCVAAWVFVIWLIITKTETFKGDLRKAQTSS